MIFPGLMSVTFRHLEPEDIIRLAEKAGMHGIEWEATVHVPHGEIERAEQVARQTRDAGLRLTSYGSYYKAGCDQKGKHSFESVLETALALQVPSVRVWAGDRGTQEADESWWKKVIEDSRRIAERAAKEGLLIDFEYHGDTLTDRQDSADRLMREIDHSHVRCNWQPPVDQTPAVRLKGLKKISPWLANIHVFQWDSTNRLPLKEGTADWTQYLQTAARVPGERFAMLEFVKDDDPQQFLEDAEVLKKMLSAL